jgi:hypothetical protein
MDEVFQRRIVRPSSASLANLEPSPIFVPVIKEHAFCLARNRRAFWKIEEDALSLGANVQPNLREWAVLECAPRYEIQGYKLLAFDFLLRYEDALLLMVLGSQAESDKRSLSVISLKHFYPLPPKAEVIALKNDATEMFNLYAPFSEFCASLP